MAVQTEQRGGWLCTKTGSPRFARDDAGWFLAGLIRLDCFALLAMTRIIVCRASRSTPRHCEARNAPWQSRRNNAGDGCAQRLDRHASLAMTQGSFWPVASRSTPRHCEARSAPWQSRRSNAEDDCAQRLDCFALLAMTRIIVCRASRSTPRHCEARNALWQSRRNNAGASARIFCLNDRSADLAFWPV